MISKSKLFLLIAFIVGLFMGALLLNMLRVESTNGYMYYFKIMGDVENPIYVRSMDDYEGTQISYHDKKIKGIPLSVLIKESSPLTENATILFVGIDGLTSEISFDSIEESYIHFSKENGWNVINLNHPISSNIKHLKEIVVAASDEYNDFGINIFTENENIKNITCGQLYKGDAIWGLNFEGTSKIEVNNIVNHVSVYTTQKLVPLNRFYHREDQEVYVIFDKNGSQIIETGEGFLRMNENTISYVSQSKEAEIDNIVGIYCGRLLSGITDTFYDTDYYLKNDKKVMVILLDGLSYAQYEFAKNNGYMPYTTAIETVKKAFSAVKPVTNTGFSTMITGKTPDVHGVHDRSIRDYSAVSIFGKALEYHKKAVLVEGDIKILNTEIEPILNTDANQDGDVDDEVFEAALIASQDVELCFIHFHGIDDRGHSFGPMSEEVNQYLTKIDNYIETLNAQWEGILIITADHGMHANDQAGSHGICRYEDMIVPYMVVQKY